MGHCRPRFLYFRLYNSYPAHRIIKFCRWLDSNLRSLATEPHPHPLPFIYHCLSTNFSDFILCLFWSDLGVRLFFFYICFSIVWLLWLHVSFILFIFSLCLVFDYLSLYLKCSWHFGIKRLLFWSLSNEQFILDALIAIVVVVTFGIVNCKLQPKFTAGLRLTRPLGIMKCFVPVVLPRPCKQIIKIINLVIFVTK